MPDEQDPKDSEMSYTNYGLSPEEGNELRTQLDSGEWQALLTVQQLFAATPMTSPDAGFSNRVMVRLAERERARAQRRTAIGIFAFGLGSMLLTAFLVWSSPLGALAEPSGWVALLNGIAFTVSAGTTVLVILGTFAQTLWNGQGVFVLVLLALFVLCLTWIWTYVVTRPALASRLIRSTEALK